MSTKAHDKARTIEDRRPQVDVIYWNASSFYIRCPYCEGFHHHGLRAGSPLSNRSEEVKRLSELYAPGSRVSHCGQGGGYRYRFPFDAGKEQIGYEIDKMRARFVNSLTLEDLKDFDEEMEIADSLAEVDISEESEGEINIYEAAKETEVRKSGEVAWEEKTIIFAMADCVEGRVTAVQKYLRETSETSIFLHGRDHAGNTNLIKASCEKTPAMVVLLLDAGSEVNAVNHRGRSALMEAALWGRIEIVKKLLERGANKDVRDKEKRSAVDLAQPMRKNQKERHERVGGSSGSSRREPLHKEDSFNRDEDRREIVRFLVGDHPTGVAVCGTTLPNGAKWKDYSFRRSPTDQSIVFRGPFENYPVDKNIKTVARLERGSPFPPIAAMSGWSHEWSSVRVSGRDLTSEVIRIAATVGHDLSPDDYDQGIPGRFNACHAQKQLIAYFVDRHVFLPQNSSTVAVLEELESLIWDLKQELRTLRLRSARGKKLSEVEGRKEELESELDDEYYDQHIGEYDEEKVKQLRSQIENVEVELKQLERSTEVREMRKSQQTLERKLRANQQQEERYRSLIEMEENQPLISLREATILISSPKSKICTDCENYKDKVNEFFGLSIEWYERTEIV